MRFIAEAGADVATQALLGSGARCKFGGATLFQVPSGTLWFAGAEYVFRRDDTRLRTRPHLGTRFELPEGVYQATISHTDSHTDSHTEYPDKANENEVERQLGAEAHRLRTSADRLRAAAVFISPAALLSLALSRLALWSLGVAALVVLLGVAAARLARSPGYRKAEQQREEIERNFPCLVAELRSSGRG